MLRRFALCATLLCYGVISLFGQGLHEWIEHAGDDDGATLASAAAPVSAGLHFSGERPGHGEHDSEHCPICQLQSMGQLFVATGPALVLLGQCELLSPPAPDSIDCPALFSVAQPRTPRVHLTG